MYDYGARFYMPDLGRWGVVDPLAEHSQDKTSYHYCSGNPINRLDPNGMCDDPNCSHGGLRRAWDSVGRFFGGWGYAENKQETNKKAVEVGPLERLGQWLDEPVDTGTAQAAEDLAHSSMPGNFTMPNTNEGVLLSIAVAFGSAMQDANGFRSNYLPKGRVVNTSNVELMGGSKSSLKGYMNYDINAKVGIKDDVGSFGKYFNENSLKNVEVNNPQANFLPAISGSLSSDGKVTVRGTMSNPYFNKIWNGKAQGLDGYKVINTTQNVSNNGYLKTNGTPIQGQINQIILKRK